MDDLVGAIRFVPGLKILISGNIGKKKKKKKITGRHHMHMQ